MSVVARLNGLAQVASKRTDVIIVAFMLMAIAMMIIPLPTFLVDGLIGVNIALSLLILIVAFYIIHSVDFSALPPLILLSTLFRLALSITTTRLILLHGDAGHIVKAFGDFVIAGQVVVGLVVFLIITIAQFIVITKGAERVAEVAARFTLDAMPGKQMSIDNDLRNGDIDQPQARLRRSRVERESQMFGAMDGAMKFVKGDAIASLVILAVNLLGGLLIGMVERDMAFAEAARTYALLSVGDGLIAQIPALMISVAAGMVVTRVNSDGGQGDLGSEIIRQLGANHRALALTALVLVGIGLLPGFPAAVFIVLAMVFGAGALIMYRRQKTPQDATGDVAAVEEDSAEPIPQLSEDLGKPLDSRLLLILGSALAASAPPHGLRQRMESLSHELRSELGIDVPIAEVYVDPSAPGNQFRIELEGVPVNEGLLPAGQLLLHDDPVHLHLLQIPWLEASSPLDRRPAHWLEHLHEEALKAAGVEFLYPDDVLRNLLDRTLRRYAGDFVGIQETRSFLERAEGRFDELIKEVLRSVPLQRMAEVLRLLIGEGVSIRNQRALLEGMVEWGPKETDASNLAEHLRAALARQLCHQHADGHRVISVFMLEPHLEEQLLSSLRRKDLGRFALTEDLSRPLLQQLRQACEPLVRGANAALLVHPGLRRSLRRLVDRGELDMAVLSFRELATEYNVLALATIGLTAISNRREPVAAPITPLANAS
ncbi:type III secretion system export apparatus subunit SctV [Pseudomonas fluorescens]|uniref:Type III secretion protein n=1 Tax=Pseudomonas fluorescens TaxID=294 RepID=A0A0F4V770_PSEFL|nr:type III secretion system export apparatus subunit SctV [Pseudomonas fluorescens]KJZ64579.1 type III secretion protein [Pseudomonas fluorescens]